MFRKFLQNLAANCAVFTYLLSLIVKVVVGEADFRYFPECSSSNSANNTSPLPKLADSYQLSTYARLADIVSDLNQTQFQINVTHVYQRYGSRGASFVTQANKSEERMFYNFDSGEVLRINIQANYCAPITSIFPTLCTPYAFALIQLSGSVSAVVDACNMKITAARRVGGTSSPAKNSSEDVYVAFKQCIWISPTTKAGNSTNILAGNDPQGFGSYWTIRYYYKVHAPTKANSTLGEATKLQQLATASVAAGETIASVPSRIYIRRIGYDPWTLNWHSWRDPQNLNKPFQIYDFVHYSAVVDDERLFGPPAGVNCTMR